MEFLLWQLDLVGLVVVVGLAGMGAGAGTALWAPVQQSAARVPGRLQAPARTENGLK